MSERGLVQAECPRPETVIAEAVGFGTHRSWDEVIRLHSTGARIVSRHGSSPEARGMKLLAPLERDIGLQPCESLVPESAGRSDHAVTEEVVRLGST